MQTNKSSSVLKADARENLLGNYRTVILAYIIIQFITSGCLSLVESQSDFHSVTGNLIYILVYLIVSLFLAVFAVGQNYMYVKLSKKEAIATRDIWYAFKTLADKCMVLQIIIFAKIFVWMIPLLIASTALVVTKNYFLSLAVAFTLILFLIMAVLILIQYSQVFFFILDYPQASVKNLLEMSKSSMNGHKVRFFYLMASFTGIYLIILITFGIASLWAYPYINATKAVFYLNLTGQDQIPQTPPSSTDENKGTKINLTV